MAAVIAVVAVAAITAGSAQVATHGTGFFMAGSAAAAPAAPARTVPGPAMYSWVITLQWSGGMLTCAGKAPAVSSYALFLSALAKCQKMTGPDAVVIVWAVNKNALGP